MYKPTRNFSHNNLYFEQVNTYNEKQLGGKKEVKSLLEQNLIRELKDKELDKSSDQTSETDVKSPEDQMLNKPDIEKSEPKDDKIEKK